MLRIHRDFKRDQRVLHDLRSDCAGMRSNLISKVDHDRSLIPPCSPQGDQWIEQVDRDRFRSDGYMVIRNVVPTNIIANAIREITAFLRADLHDSSTWYRNAP